MANTPGGGALVLGVDDKSGSFLGTALDQDWLRHRIYERVEVAPLVEEAIRDGVRLLVLYVAEAREPVENLDGQLRWRTGRNCVPVDRAEWWQHRQQQAGADPMASETPRTAADISPGALAQARRYLAGATDVDADEPLAGAADTEMLRRLGAVRPNGHLTQAGVLIFCPLDHTAVSLTALDVQGGDVLSTTGDLANLSLLEQIAVVEARLDVLNSNLALPSGFSQRSVRRLPPRAVREAVLNGAIHRDWQQRDPVAVTWVEADSSLDVVSPGGFSGGITTDTLLTQRYARYPALSDLFRALNLVEKQGLGVDRMYRDMVTLGHRPPVIAEHDGPRVRLHLAGGNPVVPVMALVDRILPAIRRRDVRVALIVHTLLYQPFVQARTLTSVLQRQESEVEEALDATAECVVDERPLVERFKDTWVLSPASLSIVERAQGRQAVGRQLLPYRRPSSALPVAQAWLSTHARYTSGDHARLTGLTVPGALRQLQGLENDGILVRGEDFGRNAHFVAGPRLRES